MKDLKRMTIVFWASVAGVAICLGGTIYTVLAQHRVKQAFEASAPRIPVPAIAPGQLQHAPEPAQPANPGNIPVPAR
ncbi:MAG: hypothetical protein P4M08_15070 [Oligoflexia bacterium]|nr:hypothetical protein [Oligoflexia bacterium]